MNTCCRMMARRAIAAALAGPDRGGPRTGGRMPPGRPAVRSSGEVEDWRREPGLPVRGISLSHAAGFAAALAWLPGRSDARGLLVP